MPQSASYSAPAERVGLIVSTAVGVIERLPRDVAARELRIQPASVAWRLRQGTDSAWTIEDLLRLADEESRTLGTSRLAQALRSGVADSTPDNGHALEARLLEINGEIGLLQATISRVLADQHVDQREAALVTQQVADLQHALTAIAGQLACRQRRQDG